MNKIIIALSVTVATLINYGIHLHRENSHLERLIKLSDTRSDINQEWANEITHVMLNKLSTENEEGMRNQGSMEGIV